MTSWSMLKNTKIAFKYILDRFKTRKSYKCK